MEFCFDQRTLECAKALVWRALYEDGAERDLSSLLACPGGLTASLELRAREDVVVAGLQAVSLVMGYLDARIKIEFLAQDGRKMSRGAALCRLMGPLRPILTGERTMLNILQRLCGVATLTAHYVEAAGKDGAKIVDTRKTMPGFRRLDKYAVRCGGGVNHRLGLDDMIMFKDNHLALSGLSYEELFARARKECPGVKIAVEAESYDAALELAGLKPDLLMLDNMPVDEMRRVAQTIKGTVLLEATGGVTLDNLHEVAHCGVDRVSIGAITHGAKAVDLGLDAC